MLLSLRDRQKDLAALEHLALRVQEILCLAHQLGRIIVHHRAGRCARRSAARTPDRSSRRGRGRRSRPATSSNMAVRHDPAVHPDREQWISPRRLVRRVRGRVLVEEVGLGVARELRHSSSTRYSHPASCCEMYLIRPAYSSCGFTRKRDSGRAATYVRGTICHTMNCPSGSSRAAFFAPTPRAITASHRTIDQPQKPGDRNIGNKRAAHRRTERIADRRTSGGHRGWRRWRIVESDWAATDRSAAYRRESVRTG